MPLVWPAVLTRSRIDDDITDDTSGEQEKAHLPGHLFGGR